MNLIILLFVVNSYMPFESFWEFYTDNRISSSACGMGYTGVANTGDISSTFINPASLSLENKKQLYFEYVYKNDIEWIADIKYKNLNPNFSVGFSLPINDFFQTGIIYKTENSLKADYGEMTETAVSDTAQTGFIVVGTIEAYRDFRISSFSVPIAFKFKDILNIGIDLSYTNFYSKYEFVENIYADTLTDSTGIEPNISTVDFNKIRPKFGIILSPIKNLSLGLTYLPEAKESIIIENDTLDPNIFPSKIGIGISYKLVFIPLSLSLDYKYSNNSAEENLVDRNDIHFGLGYDINNNFTLKGGFFSQKDYRSGWSLIDDYDQIFTTFGISYKTSFLTLNLSLMDSHLFSNGSIEQTYVNTGISYSF
jgi:long-subunit fatty acid transport protein